MCDAGTRSWTSATSTTSRSLLETDYAQGASRTPTTSLNSLNSRSRASLHREHGQKTCRCASTRLVWLADYFVCSPMRCSALCASTRLVWLADLIFCSPMRYSALRDGAVLIARGRTCYTRANIGNNSTKSWGCRLFAMYAPLGVECMSRCGGCPHLPSPLAQTLRIRIPTPDIVARRAFCLLCHSIVFFGVRRAGIASYWSC